MSLWSIHEGGTENLIFKWDHYLPIYEKFLYGYVNRSVLIFEIGVMGGGSLELWRKYLGPSSMVVGIDIDPACRSFASTGIAVEIGDQSDPVFLQHLIDKYGSPDVVIDDGSHQNKDTLASFNFFRRYMNKNSVYIVEDLHTAYMDKFSGNAKGSGSIFDLMRMEVDEMHAKYRNSDSNTKDSGGTFSPKTGVSGMHIYDSLLIFEFDYMFEPHATQSKLSSSRSVSHFRAKDLR
jgi:hypothetical protein